MEFNPVVKKLKQMVRKNGWTGRFEKAIAMAQKQNVPTIKNVKTLDDYYAWINDLLIWVPREDEAGTEIYYRISEFYFFLDQKPVKELQNKITPHDQEPKLTELSRWMLDYANEWGKFLDTTESITAKSLKSIYDSPRYNMDEYMPAPSGWRTFNQFFARHVKPGMRPIAALCDDHVVVAPADSTFVGWWQINEQSKIMVRFALYGRFV